MRKLRVVLALLLLPFVPIASGGLFLSERRLRLTKRILIFLLSAALLFPVADFWLARRDHVEMKADTTPEVITFESGLRLSEEAEVYYTESGSVFHAKADCVFLKNSMDIQSEKLTKVLHRKKRRPCTKCYKTI